MLAKITQAFQYSISQIDASKTKPRQKVLKMAKTGVEIYFSISNSVLIRFEKVKS